MNEMVERVAKALAHQHAATHDHVTNPNGFVAGWWRDFVDEARAAIAAMREPTGNMLAKVCIQSEFSLPSGRGGRPHFEEMMKAWRAMIDAALADGTMTAPTSQEARG